jgi:hypothetical protein
MAIVTLEQQWTVPFNLNNFLWSVMINRVIFLWYYSASYWIVNSTGQEGRKGMSCFLNRAVGFIFVCWRWPSLLMTLSPSCPHAWVSILGCHFGFAHWNTVWPKYLTTLPCLSLTELPDCTPRSFTHHTLKPLLEKRQVTQKRHTVS